MTNVIDIPTVVGALINYFAIGGSETELAAIKGTTGGNKALMLSDLKDELLPKQEIKTLAEQVEQQPLGMTLQQQLHELLMQELERHPAFQQLTDVHIEGGLEANNGSVAVGAINEGMIDMNEGNGK